MKQQLTKKALAQQWIKQHCVQKWLACPYCQQVLIDEEGCLRCCNRHEFDMAKQGYYYLTRKQSIQTKYDQSLFQARRQMIIESALYQLLHQKLAEEISAVTEQGVVLDAGSGEGSHLYQIMQKMSGKWTAIGIDLSKAGIKLSTDYVDTLFSCVGDLAHLPIQDNSVDVILSILSPANYKEFQRVITPKGKVIKVVPGRNYLKELRQVLVQYHLQEQVYQESREVVDVFFSHFPKARNFSLQQQVAITPKQQHALLKMSPLSWNLSSSESQQLLEALPSVITLDVEVLVS